MKRAFLLISTLLITIFISACGSSPEGNAPEKNSNTAGSNTAGSNTAIAPGIPSAQPSSNDLANMPSQGNIAMGDRRKIVDNPTTGPIPPPPARPAPENSEISTTMGKGGAFIETRVFKDNTQLLKIEKTMSTPKDARIKIWLKNGRVVSIPGDKIESLGTVSVAAVLKLAGVKPPPTPVPPAAKVNPDKLRQLKENQ